MLFHGKAQAALLETYTAAWADTRLLWPRLLLGHRARLPHVPNFPSKWSVVLIRRDFGMSYLRVAYSLGMVIQGPGIGNYIPRGREEGLCHQGGR